jgi:hypothetical protein
MSSMGGQSGFIYIARHLNILTNLNNSSQLQPVLGFKTGRLSSDWLVEYIYIKVFLILDVQQISNFI